MARYRKVDTRMWGDEKFRSLSSAPPNAQTIWIYLLTGPSTVSIPGLYRCGVGAICEDLGWDESEGFREGFREAFREVLAKGLAKVDRKARVIWIPNAIKYNPPESPNVVRGWRTVWDEVPECALKVEAWHRLKAFTEGLSKAFREAFGEACPHPSPNQEQEQEQEQDLSHLPGEKISASNGMLRTLVDVEREGFEKYNSLAGPNAAAVSKLLPISREEFTHASAMKGRSWKYFAKVLVSYRETVHEFAGSPSHKDTPPPRGFERKDKSQ